MTASAEASEESIMIVDIYIRPWESPDQLGQKAAQRIRNIQKTPWQRTNTTTQAFKEAIQPIDLGVILGLAPVADQKNTGLSNQQVAKIVEIAPEKLIGFAGVNPINTDLNQALASIKACNLQGVVINPALHGFHPSHTDAYRLYEKCQTLKLPIIFDNAEIFSAVGQLAFGDPLLIDSIASDFPNLKIVIAQMGQPFTDHCLAMLGRHAHVYADISAVGSRSWDLYQVLIAAYQRNVIDKIIMGSNYPFDTPAQVIHQLLTVSSLANGTGLPTIPRELLRLITESNITQYLGLKQVTSQPSQEKILEAPPQPKAIDLNPAEASQLLDVAVQPEKVGSIENT